MKKIFGIVLLLAAAIVLFGCNNGNEPSVHEQENQEPIDIPEVDINDSGSHVELTAKPAENEEIPADSIRNYVNGTSVNWSVYNVFDLVKLAEIVNGGDSLSGVTVTVQNDITVNENLLTEDYDAPKEYAAGISARGFNNLDSIGRYNGNDAKNPNEGGMGEEGIDAPFEGTFDGNGKIISGFYAYQGHQGLGFIGYAKDAVIKNVILKDACVVNYNIWSSKKDDGTTTHDGYDDDRFGGLLGYAGEGTTKIQNCFFSGVVGSKDALDRGGTVSYTGGLVGEVEGSVEVTGSVAYARIYATKHSGPLYGRDKSKSGFTSDADTKGNLIGQYDLIKAEVEADLLKVQDSINSL